MNLLRDALTAYRRAFIYRCVSDTLYYVGLSLLFWASWKVAVGVVLLLAAQELARRTGQ